MEGISIMSPTLYMVHGSPPVRAVLITAKALNIELNLKEMNFFRNDHLQPDFLQMNPQRTLPTFVDDDGFAFWDSHAIMIYLVSKYAKDDSLYPEDLRKRAVVNQRLFFESGAVFFYMRNIAKSIINDGCTSIDPGEKKHIIEAYGFLERFLDGNQWVAGDFLSIADYSLIATVSSANGVIPIDPEEFPNVLKWFQRCEQLPEYEANRKGLQEAVHMMKIRLAKKY